jgi:hypothetical protein
MIAQVTSLQKDCSMLLQQIQNYHTELEAVMSIPITN